MPAYLYTKTKVSVHWIGAVDFTRCNKPLPFTHTRCQARLDDATSVVDARGCSEKAYGVRAFWLLFTVLADTFAFQRHFGHLTSQNDVYGGAAHTTHSQWVISDLPLLLLWWTLRYSPEEPCVDFMYPE